MKQIFLWILDKVTTIFPGLLLRLMYPINKLDNQIVINLRGEIPIQSYLTTPIPTIEIYLEITNLSNFDLILDRMIIDLWFGQPTVNISILEHHRIPARHIISDIFVRSALTHEQATQIEPYTTQSPPIGYITFNAQSYFTTKIGVLEINTRIERKRI